MQYEVENLEEYLTSIPVERKEGIEKLIKILADNLPAGFELQLSYGHLGFVVPIHFIRMVIIAIRNRRCRLSILLLKRILLRYITWEFIWMINY